MWNKCGSGRMTKEWTSSSMLEKLFDSELKQKSGMIRSPLRLKLGMKLPPKGGPHTPSWFVLYACHDFFFLLTILRAPCKWAEQGPSHGGRPDFSILPFSTRSTVLCRSRFVKISKRLCNFIYQIRYIRYPYESMPIKTKIS
jgi:hypothetical protein